MARDLIHQSVKNALIKDGWTITHDPFPIKYGIVKMAADLGAEKTFAAEKAAQKIVVEVKSFLNASAIQDLKVALGQYHIYAFYLARTDPERQLFLAVDKRIFTKYLSKPDIEILLAHNNIHLLVVDRAKEKVTLWIDRSTPT